MSYTSYNYNAIAQYYPIPPVQPIAPMSSNMMSREGEEMINLSNSSRHQYLSPFPLYNYSGYPPDLDKLRFGFPPQ